MTVDATQLLKRLNPAVRPAYGASGGAGAATPIDQQSFDQLLTQASRGGIVSGRQVEVGCDMHPPLDASQLERLTSAADQAEASGSKRALMLIDGRAVVLDVSSRTIEAEVSSQSAASMYSVDSAIRVASDSDSDSTPLKYPGSGVLPSSITKQFLNTSS